MDVTHNKTNPYALILLVIFLASCTTSSIMTSSNVTSPVIFGPIKNIGGKKFESANQPSAVFNAETSEFFMVAQSQDATGNKSSEMKRSKEGSNKIDAEILKIAPQGDLIKVKQVNLGAWGLNYIFVFAEKSYTAVEGAVHKNAVHAAPVDKSEPVKPAAKNQ